jgi:DNA-binding response OmpR family regulator
MNTQKKILIVDDEQLNLEFFEVMLSKLGFTVEKANDGLEALEKVKLFLPDLILLDNVMPRMSGWEVTKTLKANPWLRDIPVVMFSALDDVKDKLEGYELGVEDYITKPFNFSEVLARIQVVLRNRELFAQIAVREERLGLAESLAEDMGNSLRDFIRGLDEMDVALTKFSRLGEGVGLVPAALPELVEKSGSLRRRIADLEVRIEKTMVEWEELKKNEIGLRELEDQSRAYEHRE